MQAQLKSVAQEMRGGFFPIRSSHRDQGSDSNGGSTTGFKSLEKTVQTHLQAYTSLVARVGQMETLMGRIDGDMKALIERVDSHERADLRVEGQVGQLQTELDRISSRLARHERNEAMHSHDDSRHEPKGFQENDQPARFMGTGRM